MLRPLVAVLLAAGALWQLASLNAAEPQSKVASAPEGFDARKDNIEHGKVESVEYESKSSRSKRKMVIYTPPGYSKDHKYPVLYLLHGAGDNESGWTKRGAAAAILDNLYAAKKA